MLRPISFFAFCALSAQAIGCGGEDDGLGTETDQAGAGEEQPSPAQSTPAPSTDPATQATTPATPGSTAVGALNPINEEAFVDEPIDQEAADQEAICQSSSEGTSLQDVVLAFAFDVSGSMGGADRELKWDPIVAATKAFFADTASNGLLATLTFFPSMDVDDARGGRGGGQAQGGGGQACVAGSYVTPNVGITELPSPEFGAAIDAVEPDRYGTPTMAVLEGTVESVRAMQTADNTANYAIVLVTDGVPQLCSEEQDDIDNVATVVGEVATDIPVYVIGVDSPSAISGAEDADGLGNLNLIAQRGGTQSAFIIDTGNPEQTVVDFKGVIEQIREKSFTCNIQIPEPPEGEEFDPELVNVTYTNTIGQTAFTYDEQCTADFGWRYDNPSAPSLIEMCPTACEQIRADTQNQGQLNVEFGCTRRIAEVR